jgi:imidazolonepropionase-like amidohydrolase
LILVSSLQVPGDNNSKMVDINRKEAGSRVLSETTLVLKGGRLINGTGADPLENSTVVIQGSKITGIGRGNDVEVPEKAVIVDISGKTLLPGLIDSHLHLLGLKTDNYIAETMIVPNGVKLLRAAKSANVLLHSGYTTVKDTGGMNAIYLKQAVEEGTIPGPRILGAGYVVTQTRGHGDDYQFLPIEMSDARLAHDRVFALICDGKEECMKAARYALREGADFIKVCTSGGVMSQRDTPEDVEFSLEEVKAIVMVAKNARTFVTSHCMSAAGMHISIEGGIKTIDHACFPDSEAIEMGKKAGTIFVATLSTFRMIIEGGIEAGYPEWAVLKSSGMWEEMLKGMRRLHDAGVTIAAGSDFLDTALMKMGKNAMELELLVKHAGFTPMEAITSGTLNGAKACALEKVIGSVEQGKEADLIVVDGDPLQDIKILQETERIRQVIKGGKIVVERGS